MVFYARFVVAALMAAPATGFVYPVQKPATNGLTIFSPATSSSFTMEPLFASAPDIAAAASAASEAAASAATAAAAAAEAAQAAADASARLAAAIKEAEAAAGAIEAPVPEPAPTPAPAPEPAKAEPAPAPAAGAKISPKLVKELRDLTGAGMMDCKKALQQEGDMEAAAEFLRKKGLAKADKKASRVAAEGRMTMAVTDGAAVLVEVNCETDFVAKDGSFISFCSDLADAALAYPEKPASGGVQKADFLETSAEGGQTYEAQRQALVAKIGENIQVRRYASRGSSDTTVGGYVHMNRIGVLVELEGGTADLAADVAMHVAALNPPYAKPDDVPQDVLEKEKKFLSEQALESGKPAEIVEKMVEGRIRKYLEEICLVSQTYVKTNDKTVQKLLEENGASMVGFTRISVGEGIEKEESDFAAEVASMAASK